MSACPYGARHFNWAEPSLDAAALNPEMHYLGNRPRMRGVVEKCTFCIQRTREGRYQACCEICPVGRGRRRLISLAATALLVALIAFTGGA